jgi:triosephosphate isomerase
MVADKVKYLLENSITPIVCLDRPYLEEQIKELFSRSLEVSKCLYVYEPVAAVGTGNPESPAEANRVCHEISFLLDNNAPILYGGSVNSVNAPLYVDENRLDGVLVGTDSLDPKSFYDILVSLS